MRISDWSSDVCSSDLRHDPRRGQPGARHDPGPARHRHPAGTRRGRRGPSGGGGERRAGPGTAGKGHHHGPLPRRGRVDRKSVGEGKGGAVSVDLGGRRILKNKNKNKQTANNTQDNMTLTTSTNR